MLPYWLLFMLWAGGAVQAERRRAAQGLLLFFVASTIVTAMMIGFRFEVGGDWRSYQGIYDNIYFLSLPNAIGVTDPGYAAVNWLAAQGNWGIVFVNTVCAALFMGGVARLAWRQPNPALAVLVAVPYLITVVAMGYTRQAAAIGLICLAVADASERHVLRVVILIGVATLFHKTAILILPVALVPVLRRNVLLGAVGAAVFAVLFVLLVRDSSDRLVSNYVSSSYDSQGAAIRVAMNLVAAVLFLLLRKRIDMPAFQKSFWTTCAILSVLAVAALVGASASAGIDRLSLYLIPLQLIIYSRLPYLLGRNGRALPSLVVAVLLYSSIVHFTWLNYAAYSAFWLPYKLFINADV